MHCPQCGVKAIHGVNFCKQCGANLNMPGEEIERKSLLSLSILIPPSLVSIAGLIGLFVTIVHLRNMDPRFLAGIAAVAGATVFGVVALFIWLLLRLSGYSQRTTRERELPTPQPTLQIATSQIDRPSITENTTRNFDPVYEVRNVRDTG
jgi:hypothetical protein